MDGGRSIEATPESLDTGDLFEGRNSRSLWDRNSKEALTAKGWVTACKARLDAEDQEIRNALAGAETRSTETQGIFEDARAQPVPAAGTDG